MSKISISIFGYNEEYPIDSNPVFTVNSPFNFYGVSTINVKADALFSIEITNKMLI